MWFEERSWSLNHQADMPLLIVEEYRDIWSHKREYMLIGLAYVFATTNLLNFPRLILENGGLAFVAAYGAVLAVVVLPVVILELALGQLTGRAPVQALYNACPAFKGVGVAQLVFSLFVLACITRYLSLLFLYVFYLFWSVIDDRPGLPWLHCKNFPELLVPGVACRESASIRFVGIDDSAASTVTPITTTSTLAAVFSTTTALLNTSEPLEVAVNATAAVAETIADNATAALTAVSEALIGDDVVAGGASGGNRLNTLHVESALSHFMRTLEQPSASVADVGQLQLWLVGVQCAVWLIVFFAICFGVRWLGKVVTVTFLVPLALLIVFAVHCALLAGAQRAFDALVWTPTDWHRLEDLTVWKTAGEQALLASGVGFGAFITIGSYNTNTNNVVRDAAVFVSGHALITALQSAVLIGLAGQAASTTGLEPSQLLEHGEGQMWQLLVYLALLPYTKVLTGVLLTISALSLLNVFFLLSQSVHASLEDGLGQRWSAACRRFSLAFGVALVGAALSFYFATQAGRHAYELAIGFLKYLTLEVILATELIAVGWFYCAHSLGMNLRTMLGSGASWCLGYFFLLFTYLLPAVPIAIGVANLWAYSFDATYSEPVRSWRPWSQLVGVAVALLPLVPIPWCATRNIWRTCRYPSAATRCQRLRHAFRSPLHYDLVRGADGEWSAAEETAGGRPAVHSPRYNLATPGYALLPHQQPVGTAPAAPLAQPEHYYGAAAPPPLLTATLK